MAFHTKSYNKWLHQPEDQTQSSKCLWRRVQLFKVKEQLRKLKKRLGCIYLICLTTGKPSTQLV